MNTVSSASESSLLGTEQRRLLPSERCPSEEAEESTDRLPFLMCYCMKRQETGADENSATKERLTRYGKYAMSLFLLGYCLNLIRAGIFARQTPVAEFANPFIAFGTMWILILWLGILEGGQGSLVGLQPIDRSIYKDSHPFAHQCTAMVYRGDNLNRFIVGRQFLVVLVVFCINLCCTVVEDAQLSGLNKEAVTVLLESGLAAMLVTVILGQLAAEVNATNCMLDFINTPVMAVTTWACLAIESSGVLHATYLVKCFFSFFTDDSTPCEESRESSKRIWFWIRVAFSSILLGASLVVTCSAILSDQTTLFEGLSVPKLVSISSFVGLTCFLGILEAMQIAVFAVVKLPEKQLEENPIAHANTKIVFRDNNFKAFLIGRQICVTTSMFLLARISTTDVDPATQETVIGVSPSVQNFFNTGLPGALITTIVASLVWRIVASCFPVQFLSNPLVYLTIRICLLLEASGVFSAAWLLADVIKLFVGFKSDDGYLEESPSLCETDEESGFSSFDDGESSVTLSTRSYGSLQLTRAAEDDKLTLASF